MTAQKSRDSNVEIAATCYADADAPDQDRIAENVHEFEITEMIIGQRVLFWARKMEAPAS